MPGAEADQSVQEIVDATLQQLWGAVNQLASIRPIAERYCVTLFGSARLTSDDPWYERTRRLAEQLAAEGCDVATGGGPGLMEAANQGAQAGDADNRGQSVGIRIHLPFEQGANPFVEQLYTHRTFFTRLHQFVRLSHAYVVLPGGVGTTLELLIVWQLLQVRHLDDVPLILVGDMWRELVEWARRHMAERATPLASSEDMRLPTCVADTDEAFAEVRRHHQRWLDVRGA